MSVLDGVVAGEFDDYIIVTSGCCFDPCEFFLLERTTHNLSRQVVLQFHTSL